jgi:hypothetical protein
MKMRTVLLILIVVAVLVTTSGSSPSEVRASTTVSSALSGGQYVLTIQMTAVTQPTGYRLLDAAMAVDPAPGCCCRSHVPCVRK